MKKSAKILSLILAAALLVGGLSSCFMVNGGEFISREELEELLDGRLDGNVTVEGGDEYHVNIDGVADGDTVAAGKAVLSAVSVYANFESRYSSGFGSNMGGTRKYSSAGAGVIYSLDKNEGDAYVITNYHVVYDYRANTSDHISNDISLYLYGQESAEYAIPATYVGGSMNYDLALLKVDGSRILAESSAMAVTLADSEDVAVLDTAIAIGNPESKGISATLGHVNVDSEYLTMLGADNVTEVSMRVMRIDTAVNSGNSGGGLFNSKGELIGIVNAKMADTTVDNIGYAIPSNVVKYVAENIIYHCADGSTKLLTKCMLGIVVGVSRSYVEYDTEDGRVHKREEVVVDSVSEGALAYGVLESGDIIKSIKIGDESFNVTRKHIIVESMLNARVGETVSVTVIRGGTELTVDILITAESASNPK